MKTRPLGKTGLQVSEIGFGCWAIGGNSYGPTQDSDSLEALETAWQKGVNFFDTADTYGYGHSENLISQFLNGKPRDKVVLATKVGWDFYGEGGSRKNFDPKYIQSACEKSLKRLGIDEIDLYQLHNPTPEVIQEGSCLDVLEDLKKQGKIRYIGISIHTERDAMAAFEDGRVDVLQLVLNILEQEMVPRILPEAKMRKIGVIAREPLACGLLTGKYDTKHEFPKEDHRRRWTRQKRKEDDKKLQKIKEILATDRFSLVRAAIEYTLDFHEVSTVIPGAKTKAQILENIQASLDPRLRSQESHQLRALFGPEAEAQPSS